MEQNIKNFDRAVEQRMNEAEVTPPFGAWNRIAAELDATPVATPAPVPAVPGSRIFMTIVAGALLLGVSVATIFLGQNKSNEINAPAIAAPVVTVPKVNLPAPEEMKSALVPVKAENKTMPVVSKPAIAAIIPIVEKTSISEVETPVIVAETRLPANSSSEVPASVQTVSNNPAGHAGQAYYFPPVDINLPERANAENHMVTAEAKTEQAKATDDDDDKKARVFSGSEQKVKFKKPRRKKFSYGHIIRP